MAGLTHASKKSFVIPFLALLTCISWISLLISINDVDLFQQTLNISSIAIVPDCSTSSSSSSIAINTKHNNQTISITKTNYNINDNHTNSHTVETTIINNNNNLNNLNDLNDLPQIKNLFPYYKYENLNTDGSNGDFWVRQTHVTKEISQQNHNIYRYIEDSNTGNKIISNYDYEYSKNKGFEIALEYCANTPNSAETIPFTYILKNQQNIIHNSESNYNYNYNKDLLHIPNIRDFGTKNPYIPNLTDINKYKLSKIKPLLFLPIPKNALTKIGPLILLLFENYRFIPDPKDSFYYARINNLTKQGRTIGRDNDPSTDMFVHQWMQDIPQLGIDIEPYPPYKTNFTRRLRLFLNIFQKENYIKFVILRDPLARLVSGFVEKCITDGRHWCYFEKYSLASSNNSKYQNIINSIGISNAKTNDINVIEARIELFENFVKRLHYFSVIRNYQVNEHFIAQTKIAYLYHFIDWFDYIIVYSKDNFGKNINRLLKRFEKEDKLFVNNDNGYDFDYYWNNWGHGKNESLFLLDKKPKEQFTSHSVTVSEKQEAMLVKKYYRNKNILKLAIEMYRFDYMYLPIKYPPSWMTFTE